MKVYIQSDIEGIAGFCFFENRKDVSMENFNHRQRMRRLLTNEINAAVLGAFDAGAEDVLINDNHGNGYNILFEELDPRCRIIHGRGSSGPKWLNFLEECDKMVLIGMHAMGGTPCSITPHSLYVINDGEMYMSEGTMAAAFAGDLGIPAVFASGDDKITAEFKEKIPNIVTVETKKALSPFMACSIMPSRACELIRSGVKEALLREDIAPFKVPGPVKLVLKDSENHGPPLVETGEAVTAPTITEACSEFGRRMPWNCYDLQLPDGFTFP